MSANLPVNEIGGARASPSGLVKHKWIRYIILVRKFCLEISFEMPYINSTMRYGQLGCGVNSIGKL